MFFVFATLLESEPDPTVDETEVQRLVRAARTGECRAARRLYSLHVSRVYRTVRPLCATDADAEDAVQATFAAALPRLAEYQYRAGTRFVAWLSTIALNVVRKRARADRNVESVDARDRVLTRVSADLEGADELLHRARCREVLLTALAELPERERQVLTLRYGAGLTAPEVAEVLDLSSANVRKIAERQRARLVEVLRPLMTDEELGDAADGR